MAILAIFFVSSCQQKPPLHPKIALVVPLSGVLASLGNACIKGAKLGLGQNKRFSLVISDNQANPEKTKEIFSQLAKDPEIVAVIGPLKCECFKAILPIIKENHLPTISLGCFHNFGRKTKGYALSLLTESEEIKAFAQFLNEKNLEWALLYGHEPWEQFFSDQLLSLVKKPPFFQKKLLNADISSFIPILKKAQILVLFFPLETARLIALQMQNAKFKGYILGRYYLFDDEFKLVIKTSMQKQVWIPVPHLSSKEQLLFKRDFLKTYCHFPHWLSTCGYAAVKTLTKIDKLNREEIKRHFYRSLSLHFKMCPLKERE